MLRSGPSPGEESIDDTPGFEGMEALARAIEMGMCCAVLDALYMHVYIVHACECG